MKHLDTKLLKGGKKIRHQEGRNTRFFAKTSLLIFNLMSFLKPERAFTVSPLCMRHFSTFATNVKLGSSIGNGSCRKNTSFRLIHGSSRLHAEQHIDSFTGTIIEHSNNSEDNSDNQAIITFETKSKQQNVTIQKGEILRTALMKRGISPHNGNSRLINCRGLGTCGTCAVEVTTPGNDKSGIEPMERNMKEKIRLNFPPHGSEDQSSNLRLACQIQVQGDILVTKKAGFWGQSDVKDDLAMDYKAKSYFGELEYVLDYKSPTVNKTST